MTDKASPLVRLRSKKKQHHMQADGSPTGSGQQIDGISLHYK